MKKNISLMVNLLLATLFWGLPLAYGEVLNSEEMISTVPAELPSYCHIKSPAVVELRKHAHRAGVSLLSALPLSV